MTASAAKQNFGDLIERAMVAPIAIERHGRVVAAMVPASWMAHAEWLDERRRARRQQQEVDQRRLMTHQRIGIELLGHAGRRRQLLGAARQELRRWQAEQLCSQDYIDRWSDWLALPTFELVERMCSDAEGWGKAMRQNSPFAVALR